MPSSKNIEKYKMKKIKERNSEYDEYIDTGFNCYRHFNYCNSFWLGML